MKKIYTNIFSTINVYKKDSLKSEIVTQMLLGDSFNILEKTSKWLKIRILEDGYKGYIKNKKIFLFCKPTHKIFILKAPIYQKINSKKIIGYLPFGSKITMKESSLKFIKFNNYWIEKKNLKPYDFKNKNIFNKIKIFKNIRYKWGGKTFKGIDCSALVQIFLNFNNRFCPRDSKDQMKFFKKEVKLTKIRKNDIIYWKGHVAIAISKKKLIHAYGPMKKTVIMDITKTIKLIKSTANLNILSVKRI